MEASSESPSQSTRARSRKGCITCRSKKVKCDEQRPHCRRCRRLKLSCEWGASTSSRQKKRPKEGSTPKAILPTPTYVQQADPVEARALDIGVIDDFDAPTTPPPDGWDDWLDELGLPTSLLGASNFPAPLEGQETSLPAASSIGMIEAHPEMALETIQALPTPKLTSPLDLLSPSLSSQKIAFTPSFELTTNEHRALHHYQNHFSSAATNKNISWSTYAVMLRHGSQTPMVMHLLVAASMMDLALRQKHDQYISNLAQRHFQTGAFLLVDEVNSGTEPDHISVLTSFWFIYKYMIRRKEVDVQALAQLSKTVLSHIKKYNLYTHSGGQSSVRPAFANTAQAISIPRDKRDFLARLIIWLFYEDVWSSFQGYGGNLASDMQSNYERSGEIYQNSTTSLETSWGSMYPDSEVIDDVENSSILKFLYDIMSLFQSINNLCQSSYLDDAHGSEIEAKLDALEESTRPIFRLTTINTSPRSRLLQNADWVVSFFYAIRIYHFRCTLNGLESTIAPPTVQRHLSSLLNIVQRAFASSRSEGQERLQFPLLMAGIETPDAIHREWILSKLSNPRLNTALKCILELQQSTGERASILLIRQILRGEGPQSTSLWQPRLPDGIGVDDFQALLWTDMSV